MTKITFLQKTTFGVTLGGCEGSRDRAKISVEIYGVHGKSGFRKKH